MEPRFDNLERVLNEFGQAFVNAVADYIIEADGIATGNMLNTLDFSVEKENGHYVVYLNHTDYFKYFDEGTEPHFPPVEPIQKWVQDKPVYPTADSNGKLPTVEQLGFLIARKISRDGTEARNVFERAKQSVIPEYEQKMADALAQDFINNYLNGYSVEDWQILKI